jgi:hypothetical protein
LLRQSGFVLPWRDEAAEPFCQSIPSIERKEHVVVSQDLHLRLVRVVEWVYRTGWPTRAHDTARMAQVFDAWWRDTVAMGCDSTQIDRCVLIDAMAVVLGDDHDAEGVEHLCSLFSVVFEAHIRSRLEEETRGG